MIDGPNKEDQFEPVSKSIVHSGTLIKRKKAGAPQLNSPMIMNMTGKGTFKAFILTG